MDDFDLRIRSLIHGVPEDEVEAVEAQLKAQQEMQKAKGTPPEIASKERIRLRMEIRAKHNPWAKVDIVFFERMEALGYEGLLQEEKEQFAVAMLDGDVCNGGFDQYFHNHSGNYAPEARDALIRHQAGKTLAILNRAMALVGTPYPTDQDARNQIMEEKAGRRRFPPFEELDQAFYAAKEDFKRQSLLTMVEAYRREGIELPELPPLPVREGK